MTYGEPAEGKDDLDRIYNKKSNDKSKDKKEDKKEDEN